MRNMSETLTTKNISPDEASKILTKSKFANRNLNQRNVERLARQMRDNKYFGLYSEPIAITASGDLINGQHRLNAVILSGTTQTMTVLTNADPDAFQYLDNVGKSRSNADVIKIAGEQYAAEKATAFAIVNKYNEGKTAGEATDVIGYELLEAIDAYGSDNVDEFARAANNIYSDVKLSKAVSLAVFLIGMEADKSKTDVLETFVDKIRGNIAVAKNDPCFELRKFVEDNRNNSKERGGTELTRDFKAVTVAWNKFIADATLTQAQLKRLVLGPQISVAKVTDYTA